MAQHFRGNVRIDGLIRGVSTGSTASDYTVPAESGTFVFQHASASTYTLDPPTVVGIKKDFFTLAATSQAIKTAAATFASSVSTGARRITVAAIGDAFSLTAITTAIWAVSGVNGACSFTTTT
jgi:hypothetical protein